MLRHPTFDNSDETPNHSHSMTLDSLPLFLLLHHLNTSPSLILRNTNAADRCLLGFSDACEEIDVPQFDVQWTIRRSVEPAVSLPAEVQEDEKGAGEVELEEGAGVEVVARVADWVEGNVELGHESNYVDEKADVGTPHAKGGLEGDFVERVALSFPVGGLVIWK